MDKELFLSERKQDTRTKIVAMQEHKVSQVRPAERAGTPPLGVNVRHWPKRSPRSHRGSPRVECHRTLEPMIDPMTLSFDQAVVAGYRSHHEAETAVRLPAKDGLPMDKISIIGRDFETREDVQGFYRPADAALEGAGAGAWFGCLFGLLVGTGLFILPVIGPVLVLGPLAGLVAGAIGDAGVGALVSGMVFLVGHLARS
jgi:hypothetical protein